MDSESTAADEAKKNRARDLADLIAQSMRVIYEKLNEMNVEVGVDAGDALELVQSAMEDGGARKYGGFYCVWADQFPADAYHLDGDSAMKRVIGRLFKEAPKLEDAKGKLVPGQAPAMECSIALTGGMQLAGILSTTPEGALRMAFPSTNPDTRERVLAISYFDAENVIAVSVASELPRFTGASKIVTG